MQPDILSRLPLVLLILWSMSGFVLYMYLNSEFRSFWKGVIATSFFGPLAMVFYLLSSFLRFARAVIRWAEED
jgi:hypothetical protein